MDQNDFPEDLSPIFGRRSIRRFSNQPVEDKQIDLLLKAAMAAPSAVARDPWRFVVVKEKGTLALMSEGLPNGKLLADAPLGIAVCGDIESAHGKQEGYMVQDCTAALENLLLAAHILGLGACWLGVYPRPERQEWISGLLELPDFIVPLSVAAIGYPAETKNARTRYNEFYVHRELW